MESDAKLSVEGGENRKGFGRGRVVGRAYFSVRDGGPAALDKVVSII